MSSAQAPRLTRANGHLSDGPHVYRTQDTIYTRRKDILYIKDRLLGLVKSPDYWSTLGQFINGRCSKAKYDDIMSECLVTNEMRILHNELIRAIIFNAHFSTVPPPGVPIPATRRPDRDDNALTNPDTVVPLATFCAGELGHVHSFSELSSRVSLITKDRRLRVESQTVTAIGQELRGYMSIVLRRALDFSGSDPPLITASIVARVSEKSGRL